MTMQKLVIETVDKLAAVRDAITEAQDADFTIDAGEFTRGWYEEEFRKQAVQLIEDSGFSVPDFIDQMDDELAYNLGLLDLTE